jgi:hypothetical protein
VAGHRLRARVARLAAGYLAVGRSNRPQCSFRARLGDGLGTSDETEQQGDDRRPDMEDWHLVVAIIRFD